MMTELFTASQSTVLTDLGRHRLFTYLFFYHDNFHFIFIIIEQFSVFVLWLVKMFVCTSSYCFSLLAVNSNYSYDKYQ